MSLSEDEHRECTGGDVGDGLEQRAAGGGVAACQTGVEPGGRGQPGGGGEQNSREIEPPGFSSGGKDRLPEPLEADSAGEGEHRDGGMGREEAGFFLAQETGFH